MDTRSRSRTWRTSAVLTVIVAMVSTLSGVAMAAVTWDPAETARVLNRPRTCTTPSTTCTDSAFTITSGAPSFAISNNGATHYLHAVWFSDHFGDSSASFADYTSTCSPNCAGVYYARSSDDGATWTGGASADAARIGPTSITGQRGTIATSGSYVYVAYVTTVGYWDRMCANADRLLYVAVNSNYGAGAWTTVALTTSGRVDYPAIAADGSNVYVVHTDSLTGKIIVDRSTNNGTSFSPGKVGWTENTFANGESSGSSCTSPPTPVDLEGYDGAPTVAASGSLVGVGWIGNTSGRAKAKISVDSGASWPGAGDGAPCTTGTGYCTIHLATSGAIGPETNNPATHRGTVSVAAASGRVGFAWKNSIGANTPKGIYFREYSSTGDWGPPRLLSCLQTAAPCSTAPAALIYNDAVSTSVAMFGTTGVGISWATCPYEPSTPDTPCNNKNSSGSKADPGSEILFKESWNDGATWWAGEGGSYRVTAANSASGSQVNELSTLVYDKPGASSVGCAMGTQGPEVGCVRYNYFMGRTRTFATYIAYLSKGTQS